MVVSGLYLTVPYHSSRFPLPLQEKLLSDTLNDLATVVAPIYKQLAPVAYDNQVCCRIHTRTHTRCLLVTTMPPPPPVSEPVRWLTEAMVYLRFTCHYLDVLFSQPVPWQCVSCVSQTVVLPFVGHAAEGGRRVSYWPRGGAAIFWCHLLYGL